jgi:hypothetical protein
LTPEFLRPFSAPKRSLLRHGARATPEAEAEAEERRQRRHHEKEMRTSWELMIDTLVKPPTGAAETDDDDTKWLRQRQRADTNTESETITGDQGSDDNDDIGTSDDGWEVGDIDTTGNGGGGLLRSSVERARRVGGQRLHRSNQDDKSSKRGDLDNSDGDATEPGSDSEQQQHGSRAGPAVHRSRDGTRVRRRHSSCDHGQRVSEDFEDAEVQSSSSRRHKRKTNPLSTSSERELTRKVVKKSKARSSRDEYDYEGHLLPIEALRKKWAKGLSPRSHHVGRHRRIAVIDVCGVRACVCQDRFHRRLRQLRSSRWWWPRRISRRRSWSGYCRTSKSRRPTCPPTSERASPCTLPTLPLFNCLG